MAERGYLDLVGHQELRERLRRAVELGRLPQSTLLHGPRGIGKQRIALWAAALLTCSGQPPRPCGTCRSCRMADHLQHPDIHWFFPMPRPKRASGPQQLEAKLEDQRASLIDGRRSNSLYREEEEVAVGIYVAAVQTIRRLAHKAPAMGSVKVFVIGRAEMLTPGLGSPEAANALLKTLEEPPADTMLILTSEVPGALLPTIRSRVQAIRVPPLSEDEVAEALERGLGLPKKQSLQLAARSNGSVGRALELSDEDYGELQRTAAELAGALLTPDLGPALAAAHRFRSFGARGSFLRVLAEARSQLRDRLVSATGAPAPDSSARDPRGAPSLDTIVAGLDALEAARELAERNVNPQLIVANLRHLAGARPPASASSHD